MLRLAVDVVEKATGCEPMLVLTCDHDVVDDAAALLDGEIAARLHAFEHLIEVEARDVGRAENVGLREIARGEPAGCTKAVLLVVDRLHGATKLLGKLTGLEPLALRLAVVGENGRVNEVPALVDALSALFAQRWLRNLLGDFIHTGAL